MDVREKQNLGLKFLVCARICVALLSKQSYSNLSSGDKLMYL